MSGKNTLGMRLKRLAILGIIIPLMVLGVSSCTKNKSSDNPAPGGTVQAKATVSRSSGGAISVNVPGGPLVTLEIPENTLLKNTEISLSVSNQTEAAAGLAISIQPQSDLLDSATLTIVYPANATLPEMYVFSKGDSGRLLPLKQSVVDSSLKSTLYRLGDYTYTLPDMNKMITDAYTLMNDSPNSSWQVSFSAFDALVWYSGYFMKNGHASEAAECTKATVDVCKRNAVKFIELAKTDNSTKDIPYVKGLKKFRALMVLNDNPGLIVKTFDELIKATDNTL